MAQADRGRNAPTGRNAATGRDGRAGRGAAGGRIDAIDRRILDELARDGRMPVSEIARRVGLSKSPCQVRMARPARGGG